MNCCQMGQRTGNCPKGSGVSPGPKVECMMGLESRGWQFSAGNSLLLLGCCIGKVLMAKESLVASFIDGLGHVWLLPNALAQLPGRFSSEPVAPLLSTFLREVVNFDVDAIACLESTSRGEAPRVVR